jgi:TolA-binding protein
MMIRRLFFALLFALPALSLGTAARAATSEHPLSVQAPAPWVDDDPADSLYRVAREMLNRSDFTRAAELFGDIGRKYPKSAYAADALYYRAFSLYRAGGTDDLRQALSSLDTQLSRYPKAKTAGDADELRVRIRGTLAKRGDASSAAAISSAASDTTSCARGAVRDDENDVRVAAMNALLQMDSESAMPIIRQVLQKRDGCTAVLRKKAVFLLSQKRSNDTEALLSDVIRNDPSSAVREDAIFWMGSIHSDRAASLLEEIATSSSDLPMREKAVFALSQQNSARSFALLRRLAEADDTPRRVRENVIFQLGQHPSPENAEYLRALYGKLGKTNQDDLRKNILFSLSQMHGVGNDRWLVNQALDVSQNIEVRKQALWTAGQAGIAANELIGMYDRLTDAAMKEQLIWVLAESRDKAAGDKLIEIATKDKDSKMREKALFWLGQKNDPRVKQIILDILKG